MVVLMAKNYCTNSQAAGEEETHTPSNRNACPSDPNVSEESEVSLKCLLFTFCAEGSGSTCTPVSTQP